MFLADSLTGGGEDRRVLLRRAQLLPTLATLGRGLPRFLAGKGHGTGQWIEGRKTIPDGSRVAVLEDVVTTGGSALKAIERCRAEQLEVVTCFALVDRDEGGREAIQSTGVPLDSLFTRKDFLP